MDVDENSSSQQSSSDAIEQSFLQQFSCLGTTDHDELVGKFQKLLGNQLNYATARFFLDMNNWNLQAAVGCYFDYYSGGQRLPSMQIIADITVGEGEGVAPNTKFQQSWKVQNNGEERWPEGCFLKLTSVPNGPQVQVPALNPGENTDIMVELDSPNECGSFQTKWRLCTPNGSHFGDTIWSIVQVIPNGTQQMNGFKAVSQDATGSSMIDQQTAAAMQQLQLFTSAPEQVQVSEQHQQHQPNLNQPPATEDAEMW